MNAFVLEHIGIILVCMGVLVLGIFAAVTVIVSTFHKMEFDIKMNKVEAEVAREDSLRKIYGIGEKIGEIYCRDEKGIIYCGLPKVLNLLEARIDGLAKVQDHERRKRKRMGVAIMIHEHEVTLKLNPKKTVLSGKPVKKDK